MSDNKLHIQQAGNGNSVQVFNIAGENIYSTVLNDNNTTLPITLKTGIYIVKVADKVTKLIVK